MGGQKKQAQPSWRNTTVNKNVGMAQLLADADVWSKMDSSGIPCFFLFFLFDVLLE